MDDGWTRRLLVATDVGLIGYWTATATGVIAAHPDAVLVAWNWSFLVLDLFAAGTGLVALHPLRRSEQGRVLLAVSLALTHAAGLTALTFWVLRGEFDLAWWLPNLWLALFPPVVLAQLSRSGSAAPSTPGPRSTGRRRGRPGCIG